MKNKKARRILSAILSAACSASCAQAAGSEPIGQTSSKITNQSIIKTNVLSDKKNKKQSNNKGQETKTQTLGNFMLNNSGKMFLSLSALAAAVIGSKSVYENLSSRSKKKELEQYNSSMTEVKNNIINNRKYFKEKEDDIKEIEKQQIACEALAFSSSPFDIKHTKIDSENLNEINEALANSDDLLASKKKKYSEDKDELYDKNSKFEEFVEKVVRLLTSLKDDMNFKDTLEKKFRDLDPSKGNGIIDLIKTSINAFEEAWLVSDVECTRDWDDEKYKKIKSNNDKKLQSERLKFIVNEFLDLLLPIEKYSDGNVKEFKDQPKATQKAAIFGCLFYKENKPNKQNQLTIEQLVTNTLGKGIIVSRLAERLKNIKEKIEIKYEYVNDDGKTEVRTVNKTIPSLKDFMNLISSSAYGKMEGKIHNITQNKAVRMFGISSSIPLFIFIQRIVPILMSDNEISISDLEIKNLLWSLVEQGVDGTKLIPKNFLGNGLVTLSGLAKKAKDIKSKKELNDCITESLKKNEPSTIGNLLSMLTCGSNNTKETHEKLLNDFFDESKKVRPPVTAEEKYEYLKYLSDNDPGSLSEDEKKQINELKLQSLKNNWEAKKISYWVDKFSNMFKGNKYYTEEELNKYYFKSENLNANFDEKDLDNLKIVHDWNFLYSCERKKRIKGGEYFYRIDGETYLEAKKAYDAVKGKCKGLNLFNAGEIKGYSFYNSSDNYEYYNPEDEVREKFDELWKQYKLDEQYNKYNEFKTDNNISQLSSDFKDNQIYFDSDTVYKKLFDNKTEEQKRKTLENFENNLASKLKAVYEWNLKWSCSREWGFWLKPPYAYSYDSNCDKYKNTKKDFGDLKILFPELELVNPQKTDIWYVDAMVFGGYKKK